MEAADGQAGQAAEVPSLLLRVGNRLCALPLAQVRETMRPLPVESFPSAAAGVAGLAIIRGSATPVVELTSLLDGSQPHSTPIAPRFATRFATRFVIATVGGNQLALAVDEVLGIRSIPQASMGAMPSLLGAAKNDTIAAIGALDNQLLLLDAARMVPDELWASLRPDGGAP